MHLPDGQVYVQLGGQEEPPENAPSPPTPTWHHIRNWQKPAEVQQISAGRGWAVTWRAGRIWPWPGHLEGASCLSPKNLSPRTAGHGQVCVL